MFKRPPKRSFTQLEILMVLLIIIFFMSIAYGYLSRYRIDLNDAVAQKSLRQMSTAIETYAADRDGVYPTNMDSLHMADPPYIEDNYCATTQFGFRYDCALWGGGYIFQAIPTVYGGSGSTSYTISTGGFLQ